MPRSHNQPNNESTIGLLHPMDRGRSADGTIKDSSVDDWKGRMKRG